MPKWTAALAHEIVAPLGAGGMAEVYRARDGRLNGDVAIKVLPEHLANDAERLTRFEREAQVLASLNRRGTVRGGPLLVSCWMEWKRAHRKSL